MASPSIVQKGVLLVLGGSVGTLARFALATYVHNYLPTSFPYGILVVNLMGCLLIGLFAGLTEKGWFLDPQYRLLAVTGFLGAFTTFSSFQYDSFMLLREGYYGRALANLLGSVVLGFSILALGYFLGRLIVFNKS